MKHRTVRTVIVIAIISYLAAGSALAGGELPRRGQARPAGMSRLVTLPLKMLKEVVVLQAKSEQAARTGVLRLGIGALTGALQWLESLAPRPRSDRGRDGAVRQATGFSVFGTAAALPG